MPIRDVYIYIDRMLARRKAWSAIYSNIYKTNNEFEICSTSTSDPNFSVVVLIPFLHAVKLDPSDVLPSLTYISS
jgi:hypothetical protein